jgi:hypothetical protein
MNSMHSLLQSFHFSSQRATPSYSILPACTDQVAYTQPCPPASPSGVVGWSSRRAGSQQLNTPPPCNPSHNVPTWADIARGGNFTSTPQEAPAASTADAIALYKRYVSMGLQARISVKHNAGYEEICLSCRFPEPSAARQQHATRHRQRQQHQSISTVSTIPVAPPLFRISPFIALPCNLMSVLSQ